MSEQRIFRIGFFMILFVGSFVSAHAGALLERISFHPRSDGKGYVVWFDVTEPLPRGNYTIQHRGNELILTFLNTSVLSDVAQAQPQGPVFSYSIEPLRDRVVFRFTLDQTIKASAYPDRSGDMILNLEYSQGQTTVTPTPKSTTPREMPRTAARTNATSRVTPTSQAPTVRITEAVTFGGNGQAITPPAPQNTPVAEPVKPTTSTTDRIRNNARVGVNATTQRIQERTNARRAETNKPANVQPAQPANTPAPVRTTPPKVTVITPDGRAVSTESTLPSSQMAMPEVVIPEPERRADGQPIIQPFGQPIITPQPTTQPATQPIIITPQPDEKNPVLETPVVAPVQPTTQPAPSRNTPKPTNKPTPKPTTQPITQPTTQPETRPVILPPPVVISSQPATQPATTSGAQPASTHSLPFIFMEEHSSPQKKALEDEAKALARQWKRSTTQDQKKRLELALDRKLSQIFETEQYLWRRKLSTSDSEDLRDQEARLAQRQEVKAVILEEWKTALIGQNP